MNKTVSNQLDAMMLECSMFFHAKEFEKCSEIGIKTLSLLNRSEFNELNEYLYRRAVVESLIRHSMRELNQKLPNGLEIGTIDFTQLDLENVTARLKRNFPFTPR